MCLCIIQMVEWKQNKKRNEPVSNLQEDNLPRLWTLVFHLRLLLSALYI